MSDLLLAPIAELAPRQYRQGWDAPRTILGRRGFHYGFDFSCPLGTPILACAPGVVRLARTGSPTAGTWIVLAHDWPGIGLSTRYLHLSRLLVAEGSVVAAGEPIGLSGSTGLSTGPHLHFDVGAGPKTAKALKARGLRETGRTLPGTGGRVAVPVEQVLRCVWELERKGWKGRAFVGEV